jgi:hypothetical protein
MQFTTRVTSITQDVILPSIVDTILGDSFIPYRIMGNAKKWSGEKLTRPIKIAKSSLGGSFSGLDTHSTATTEDRALMTYYLKGYEMPISIAGMDKAVNKTEAQVINLVRAEMESRQQDAMDDLGTMFYGDGTGNGSKDFNGFENLIDDGTVASTIGGLTRSSYTTHLDSTVTASGGTMDLDKIAALVSAVSAGASAKNAPSFMLTTETVRDLYESLLTPTVKANYEAFGLPVVTRTSKGALRGSELKGTQGFTSMTFRGLPIISDEKCTSGHLWAVNENFIEWYGLKDSDLKDISLSSETIEGMYNDAPSANVGFQWTDFMEPINQYGIVAHMYLLGELVQWNPKRHGVLTAITGV